MRPLSAGWPAIQPRILKARHVILCCDFDGTLAPIAAHPSRARLPRDTARLLQQLSRLPGLHVAFVSGRALEDLRRMIRIRDAYYIGNHGLELRGPRLRYINPAAQATRPLLTTIGDQLKAALHAIPGAWVEEKGLTLSIHWRNISKTAQRTFHRVVARCTGPYLDQHAIERTTGKRVIEIRPPVKWDKGTSVVWLLSRLSARHGHAHLLVLYFGDDQTDEAAFRATNRLRGLSIVVGHGRQTSAARYRLNDPRDVRRWLAGLLQLRREAAASRRDETWTGAK